MTINMLIKESSMHIYNDFFQSYNTLVASRLQKLFPVQGIADFQIHNISFY
jgi:hypothetical protein